MAIKVTAAAEAALRPGEVVLIDWHTTGLCCSDAGEFSVRPIQRGKVPKNMRPQSQPADECAVYVHPTAWWHLAELEVTVDCKRYGFLRHFKTDLPPDAGLRACMGRLNHQPAK
jgi:hypothetical protein